jgi:hypothetical protein
MPCFRHAIASVCLSLFANHHKYQTYLERKEVREEDRERVASAAADTTHAHPQRESTSSRGSTVKLMASSTLSQLGIRSLVSRTWKRMHAFQSYDCICAVAVIYYRISMLVMLAQRKKLPHIQPSSLSSYICDRENARLLAHEHATVL